MRFTKGFIYSNKPYGWYNKKLYRLPYKHPEINRWYNLLECAKWDNKGYFLGKDRKSFAQLKEMTSDIEEINLGEESDCPFLWRLNEQNYGYKQNLFRRLLRVDA